MQFKVQQQYERGGETTIAQFTHQADAELFIREKLKDAASMKVRVVYILSAPHKLPQTFTADASSSTTPAQSQSNQGTRSSSSPTPLSTVPRPSGMPTNWRRDKDEEKK